ncbi:MAG: ATP-binding protein, partial [Planctomycetota bacterium]
ILEGLPRSDFVTIVLADRPDAQHMLAAFRAEIFDYFIDPLVQIDDIKLAVIRGDEILQKRKVYQEQQGILKRQADWGYWKSLFLTQCGQTENQHGVIDQLHTYLNQSGGITMVMDMLREQKPDADGNVIIQQDLFDLINSSLAPVSCFMESISDASALITSGTTPHDTRLSELVQEIPKWADEECWRSDIQSQQLSVQASDVSPIADSYGLQVDMTKLKKVMQEVWTNAMKYSEANDKIQCWMQIVEGVLYITTINPAYPTTQLHDGSKALGIPMHLEILVFEYFVKFHREVYEQYREHWPAGMGLSMVRQIVEAFGGTCKLSNISNYLSSRQETSVECKIEIPLKPAAECNFVSEVDAATVSAEDDFELF